MSDLLDYLDFCLCSETNPSRKDVWKAARARLMRLTNGLREIQIHAADILDSENKPGYELREFAEQAHALAASALSSGEPVKNDEQREPSHSWLAP